MSNRETLHFKIGLSGSSLKKQPELCILVNDTKFFDDVLSVSAKETQYIEFDAEIVEGECSLVVEFKNKTKFDTVLDTNGEIIDDLLLNIDSVEIDQIDLGSLLWTHSDYRPQYPEVYKSIMLEQGKELPESVKNCVNLGWNGTWKLPFISPFYIWLLENI
jgi:hypothetical protein